MMSGCVAAPIVPLTTTSTGDIGSPSKEMQIFNTSSLPFGFFACFLDRGRVADVGALECYSHSRCLIRPGAAEQHVGCGPGGCCGGVVVSRDRRAGGGLSRLLHDDPSAHCRAGDVVAMDAPPI